MLPTIESMPRVALDSMNQTHEEELALISTLAQLLEDGNDLALIATSAEVWYHHTQEHFAREEQLMQACAFPAYTVHKAEHERVLAQITSSMLRLSEGDFMPLKQFIIHDWSAWFDLHVRTMDTATAMFASRCA